MRHRAIEAMNRSAAESHIAEGKVDELRVAVLSVALHEADCGRAEAYCARLASHGDAVVRGNAILGSGHIARRCVAAQRER